MNRETNIERLANLDCATLSDAMDRLGIVGQCAAISPRDDSFRLTGRAFTVSYVPAAKPPGTVGDYLDDVDPGEVVVLDNRGRCDVTVWGDILTELAKSKGVAGTVIDGVCRDVSLCREIGYPVFSRGHWMRTGKDRVQVDQVGTIVSVGGVQVSPGDLVRGDADGVVVLPRAHENAILDAAESIQAAEESIRRMLREGKTLRQAREAHQYHGLQSTRGT